MTARAGDISSKRCPECAVRFGETAQFCPFCGVRLKTSTFDPRADPLVGKLIDERYEVTSVLGQGGMGTVYEVRHRVIDRAFALKVLRRELAHDPALADRFLVEARAVAAIHHPCIVAASDFGTLPNGVPYFVMELVRGTPLSKVIQSRGRIAVDQAVHIARLLTDGLAAAHAAGVIHRDLKPDNVFLVEGPNGERSVRLVDFGAAKILGTNRITKTGMVFGTPYYMSPEQANGQEVDARADVYALGVVLFEMVTGRVPFDAETFMGVMTKHMFADPPRPSSLVPPGVIVGSVENVIMRALSKGRSARYASMTEMGAALAAVESGELLKDDFSIAQKHATTFGSVSSADRIEHSIERQVLLDQTRRRRSLAMAAVAIIVCVSGMVTSAALLKSGTTPVRVAKPSESTSVPARASVATPILLPPSASIPENALIADAALPSLEKKTPASQAPPPHAASPKYTAPVSSPENPTAAPIPPPISPPASTPTPVPAPSPADPDDPWLKPHHP